MSDDTDLPRPTSTQIEEEVAAEEIDDAVEFAEARGRSNRWKISPASYLQRGIWRHDHVSNPTRVKMTYREAVKQASSGKPSSPTIESF